jgi:hypothetical protein
LRLDVDDLMSRQLSKPLPVIMHSRAAEMGDKLYFFGGGIDGEPTQAFATLDVAGDHSALRRAHNFGARRFV